MAAKYVPENPDVNNTDKELCSTSFKYTRLINNRNALRFTRRNTITVCDKEMNEIVIECDQQGNNFVKSFDDYLQEEKDPDSANIFKKLLELTMKNNDQQETKASEYLTQKREFLQGKLRNATENYKANHFLQAIEAYKTALDLIKSDCYPDEYMLTECDILAIKFALVFSLISVNNFPNLSSAKEVIISLIDRNGKEFPALYYYLAKINYDLYDSKEATVVLENGMSVLNKLTDLTVLNWPGTKDTIDEISITTVLKQNMASLLEQCRKNHLPDAKCFYSLCEINKNNIYFKSPSFFGYVKVQCSNKCFFTYHAECWKKKVKKQQLKNFTLLETSCGTDDCGGVINSITIFNKHLHVTSGISSKDHNVNKIVDSKSPEKKPKKLCKIKSRNFTDTKASVCSNQDVSNNILQLDTNLDKLETVINNNLLTKSDCETVTSTSSKNFNKEENNSLKQYINSNQTSQNNTCFVPKEKYDQVKKEADFLEEKLFQSESKYNVLLKQFKSLEDFTNTLVQNNKIDSSTQTDHYEDLKRINDELQNEVCHLNFTVNEMKISQLFEQEIHEQHKRRIMECELLKSQIKALNTNYEFQMKTFSQNEKKLLAANNLLVQQLTELKKINEILQQEFNKYKKINDLLPLRIILFEQINSIKMFYKDYVSEFTDKCKIIIHELDVIKIIINTNSLPPKTEVEENLVMWKECLSNVVRVSDTILEKYELFQNKFSTEPTECINLIPVLQTFSEPPNILVKYFQSFIHINKNLQQSLNNILDNYYRTLSIPYPGKFPSIRMGPLFSYQNTPVEMEVPYAQIQLSNAVLEERSENNAVRVVEIKDDSESIVQGQNLSKQETTEESEVEVEGATCVVLKKEEKKIPKIVGPDDLLYKLQQKFPLISPKIVEHAFNILRKNQGSLSGMDSRYIILELKRIMSHLLKNEQENNPKYYHMNGLFCGKCSICMDKMFTENSVKLQCKHTFHTQCINTWLENNSVCPICRAYTTVDNDFFPLNK